jgi:predicted nucleic acid-binding protein
MNGNKALLDSNIIIYLSKGTIDFDELSISYDHFFISIITYMEVLGYHFTNEVEKKLIEELLNQFEILNVDLELANNVIEIRRTTKIKLPDAIIFATADINNCDLITNNISDFKTINAKVKLVEVGTLSRIQKG